MKPVRWMVVVGALAICASPALAHDKPASCSEMRQIGIAVAVTPPNVAHTTPHVARELGYFTKRCIEPNILERESAFSPTTLAAIDAGLAIGIVTETAAAGAMGARQIWGAAPILPQLYLVTAEIRTPADLKGKRLSAAGGGVGSFNWQIGRELLQSAGLTVHDAQFVAEGASARLPGFLEGQLDGVPLHPEDVFIARAERPEARILTGLAELLPDQQFNAYGASETLIARDRQLLVDTVAAMIEANRTIYADKEKVIPIMVKATGRAQKAVEFAWEENTRHCVWSINTGFDRSRTEWTVANAVRNGDLDESRKPSFEQVAEVSIAEDAVRQLGGPIEISGCRL